MGTEYKPFKNFKQMINQPSSKHWFERDKLTKEKGFNSLKEKKKNIAQKMKSPIVKEGLNK